MESIKNIVTDIDSLSFKKVLKFVIPTYLTSLFTTMYSIVDGIFVSQYVGTNALAAINVIYPIIYVLLGTALMFAIGGSAIASISIGSGNYKKAQNEFSLSFVTSIIIGFIITVLVAIFFKPISHLLGATGSTMEYCIHYIVPWLAGFPMVIGKEIFIYFIRIDGNPRYSFLMSLLGGITNIILDYIFIVKMGMGIFGAGLATIIGISISFAMGIYYILCKRNYIKFGFTNISLSFIPRCAINGLSEFINQIAIAITTVAFNVAALNFAGDDGIAAVSIIMYLQFLFIGIAFGYSMGTAPLLGYAFGNGRKDICRKIEKYSFKFLGLFPGFLYIVGFILAPLAVSFFAKEGTAVYNLAIHGMRVYSTGYIVFGISIFAAVRLTSYAQGHLSAIITVLRSFLLLLLFLFLLPKFWGMDGIWLSVPFSEFITVVVAVVFTYKTRRFSEPEKSSNKN